MNSLKIYVASSWRNQYQQEVVQALRALGHEVYDFKNPNGQTGFSWAKVSSRWQQWQPWEYTIALEHPEAKGGFQQDFDAMKWADICVYVMPCGRSASVEAGWFAGQGKKVFVYHPEPAEAELMYLLFDAIATTFDDLKGIIQMMTS